MKGILTKQEGFRIQDSVSRIILILDPGFWILNPSLKLANRFLRNSGINYQDLAG